MKSLVYSIAIAATISCGTSAPSPVATSVPDASTPECTADVSCVCPSGGASTKRCESGKLHECNCFGVDGPSDAGFEAGPVTCTVTGRYYVDADHDGFGAGPQIDVCEPAGSGFSVVAGDCDDADELAFPGQSIPQDRPRKGMGGGDFNCDGVEKKDSLARTDCSSSGANSCSGGGASDAWLGIVPECGATGSWLLSCSVSGTFTCNASTVQRIQKCL